jgi:RsiW-degrading membrane proteinase PrsW (M82 family)
VSAGPRPGGRPASAARDTRGRRVLLVAGILPVLYAVLVVLRACFARSAAGEAGGLYSTSFPPLLADVLSLAVYGLAIAAIVWPVGAIARLRRVRRGRRPRPVGAPHIVIVAALALPYALATAEYAARYAPMLGICLPGTAFALCGLHWVQRYRRMPVWMLLAAFAWGLVIAFGYTVSVEFWAFTDIGQAIPPRTGSQLVASMHSATVIMLACAGFFEELAKLVGVAILFILFSRRLDGLVSGVVLGAAAGLGLNLAESFINMGESAGAAASQFWLRQCVGLMAAHTAFTALSGAGIGLAQQLRAPRAKLAAVACGLLAASCGHFASDAILAAESGWHIGSQEIAVLVVLPALIVATQGPFIVMYVLLLRRGLRAQARGLAAALGPEVGSGRGAITAAEATVLLSPPLRFWARVTALLRYGPAAWYQLGRLHAAQADLAMRRWRRTQGTLGGQDADDDGLRSRIRELRAHQVVILASTGQQVPA